MDITVSRSKANDDIFGDKLRWKYKIFSPCKNANDCLLGKKHFCLSQTYFEWFSLAKISIKVNIDRNIDICCDVIGPVLRGEMLWNKDVVDMCVM